MEAFEMNPVSKRRRRTSGRRIVAVFVAACTAVVIGPLTGHWTQAAASTTATTHTASAYFGVDRTESGYIPGL
jgi:hypothetical protein